MAGLANLLKHHQDMLGVLRQSQLLLRQLLRTNQHLKATASSALDISGSSTCFHADSHSCPASYFGYRQFSVTAAAAAAASTPGGPLHRPCTAAARRATSAAVGASQNTAHTEAAAMAAGTAASAIPAPPAPTPPPPSSTVLPKSSAAEMPAPGSNGAAAAAIPPSLPSHQDLLLSEQQRMRGGKGRFVLLPSQRLWLRDALTRMTGAATAKQRALEAYVPATLWRRAAPEFRRWMLRSINLPLLEHLMAADRTPEAADATLFAYFLEYCRATYPQELAAYETAATTMDMRAPETWYPYARAIQRKIIYHAGPTNSGKTYNALQALAAAERGVYCSPLRLLAMEVYESLNAAGVRCDMVTGQEMVRVPGAAHVACTVEMAMLQTHADVAVVDEIQMIGDEQRGFAWTRALLGIPANELHVCGDLSAVDLVRSMAEACGDEFQVVTYERMTPLELLPQGLPNGLASVQPGDCLVAFSRRLIHDIRRQTEAVAGVPTCVVYGALPAETRRAQAKQFNDPNSPAKVLVASDAIGMGLNFNIQRVIFTSLHKSGGKGHQLLPIPPALVKQIAGRAGRRNSNYPKGYVTTLHPRDMPALRAALDLPLESLVTPKAGLYPEFETIEMLSTCMPGTSFYQLLHTFADGALLEGRYFFSNQDELLKQARRLEEVPGLSLEDRYSFCMAPVARGSMIVETAFLEFAFTYAKGLPVTVDEGLMPPGLPTDEREMAYMEDLYKVMALWLWLANRFEEDAFPGRHKVEAMAAQLCAWMDAGLTAGHAQHGRHAEVSAPELSVSSSEQDAVQVLAPQPPGNQQQEAAAADWQRGDNTCSSSSSVLPSNIAPAAAAVLHMGRPASSSDEESDWEDIESPVADGAALRLHVVHHHHAGGDASSMLAQDDSGSGMLATNGSAYEDLSSSSSNISQQHRMLPWVQEVQRAVAAGRLEEVMQPAWDSSMWQYVVCKSGAHSKLQVPPPAAGASPTDG